MTMLRPWLPRTRPPYDVHVLVYESAGSVASQWPNVAPEHGSEAYGRVLIERSLRAVRVL
jgi:hypothetical protein